MNKDKKVINNNDNYNNNLNENRAIKKNKLRKLQSLRIKDNELEKKILLNKLKKKMFLKESKLYYLCPLCIIKNKKNLKYFFSIKNRVCKTFSLENYIDFINTTKAMIQLNKEKSNYLGYKHKSNFTDKNVRREINNILNIK